MADSTRLTEVVRVEEGRKTPSPRLQKKLLEGVPRRAGMRGIEEVRSLAHGMPTEFTTADGEKVTLVMRGPGMAPKEERKEGADVRELELELRRDILRMLPKMERDERGAMITVLLDAPALPFMPLEMAPRNYLLYDFTPNERPLERLDILRIERSIE